MDVFMMPYFVKQWDFPLPTSKHHASKMA